MQLSIFSTNGSIQVANVRARFVETFSKDGGRSSGFNLLPDVSTRRCSFEKNKIRNWSD